VGIAIRAVVMTLVLIVGVIISAISPFLTIALIVTVLFAALGWYIGEQRGRGSLGLILGLFLGPIGLLIVAVMEPAETRRGLRACPWCAERIQAAARICRYCGRDVTAAETTGRA
jgi:hypothetical protein